MKNVIFKKTAFKKAPNDKSNKLNLKSYRVKYSTQQNLISCFKLIKILRDKKKTIK